MKPCSPAVKLSYSGNTLMPLLKAAYPKGLIIQMERRISYLDSNKRFKEYIMAAFHTGRFSTQTIGNVFWK